MDRNFEVRHRRLSNLMEGGGASSIAGAARAAAANFARGSMPSLQCLLFANPRSIDEIRNEILSDRPDTLYLDGVRSFYLLKALHPLLNGITVTVDLDDLMSRRMAVLGEIGAPLSLGYLRARVPAVMSSVLAARWPSRLISGYERRALGVVESQIGRWADTVTLVSSIESALLQREYEQQGSKAKVLAVPPPIDVMRPPRKYPDIRRFIFIGTDALVQNRLSIELLLEMWRTLKPATPLEIFGQMQSVWPAVPNVRFHGYSQSLDDVYTDGSVLIAPGVLSGGLKTKVLEAFAYGCAVIGNSITFEGMDLPDYPLLVEDAENLSQIVKQPQEHTSRVQSAAELGQHAMISNFNRELFERRWMAALS